MQVQSLDSLSGLGIWCCCELWCREGRGCGWDPKLLWLWHRPAVVAPIGPLAWELPYAMGVALKKKKESIIRWAAHYLRSQRLSILEGGRAGELA